MGRLTVIMRMIALAAGLLGLAFMVAPTTVGVTRLKLPEQVVDPAISFPARARADSITEDIILYNLFSPSRTAPSRRYSAQSVAGGEAPGENDESMAPSSGFSPVLVGTAVSERPGETRALLQLLATDPTPRLYGVGDRAGGYSVVSIDARAVVLNGPRGRVVLRLPENEESHS